MRVYSPWVVSEGRPDTSTLERFIKSPLFADKKGEDFAVAVWQYFSSSELGIYHYCPAHDTFRDREIHDPIKILNGFGFAICHIHAHILAQAYAAGGYPVRIALISGHEGSEIFYDDGWHYFDCDLRGYSRRHPPEEHIVASREDMYRDPTIVSEQENPSEPTYYVEDRPPSCIAELVKSPPEYLRPLDELHHTMDMVLRPGESIVRYFDHEGKYIITSEYRSIWKRYFKEPGPGGPMERWEPHRRWGNGHWIYRPVLTSDYADIAAGAHVMENLTQTDAGIVVAPGETGHLIFDFDIPYPIAGIPDENGTLCSRDGALFTIKSLRESPADNVSLKLSRDGGASFEEVWFNFQPGETETIVDLTPHLENRHRFMLMIELTAGKQSRAMLTGFSADISFMNSPWALPAILPGKPTAMSYHGLDQYGAPTKKVYLELELNQPDSFHAMLHESNNLEYDPESFSVIRPKDPNKGDYELVFKLDAPENGTMSWLYAAAVWEGRKPGETDVGICRIDVRDGCDGDWKTISETEPDEHPKGWHFIKGGNARFSEEQREVYIRFRGKKGIQALRISGHYVPASARSKDSSDAMPDLEIIHTWDEYRIRHTHKETIPAGTLRHDYVIDGGEKVNNVSVEMRVPSMPKRS